MKTMKAMNLVLLFVLGFGLPLAGVAAPAEPEPSTRNVTFLSTSDCHYDAYEHEDRNARNRATLEEMNAITTRHWPEQLGGGPIDAPRGALCLGDCIDDGDRLIEGKLQTGKQYEYFLADFGFDGTDGLLKYPVYEGWGNHDGPPIGKERHGFSFQAKLKQRNQRRLAQGLVTHLSENGLHYSWDWDDVHLIQLNIYPADQQNDKVTYNRVWHDPQGSLSFLKQVLAESVGESGRPVVLMGHCGMDTNWWHPEDWQAFYDAAKAYNVVLYLYGHTGTGVRKWAPEGEEKKWTLINDGQTENGFFVVQLAGDRLRAAYRCKANVKRQRNPDRTETYTWDGSWEWRWLVDEKISRPASN
jgi:cytolysin (calcineurin-like family phosphatase)